MTGCKPTFKLSSRHWICESVAIVTLQLLEPIVTISFFVSLPNWVPSIVITDELETFEGVTFVTIGTISDEKLKEQFDSMLQATSIPFTKTVTFTVKESFNPILTADVINEIWE